MLCLNLISQNTPYHKKIRKGFNANNPGCNPGKTEKHEHITTKWLNVFTS